MAMVSNLYACYTLRVTLDVNLVNYATKGRLMLDIKPNLELTDANTGVTLSFGCHDDNKGTSWIRVTNADKISTIFFLNGDVYKIIAHNSILTEIELDDAAAAAVAAPEADYADAPPATSEEQKETVDARRW